MFKLGFSTIGCPDYSVDQIAQLSAETGLSGVEIRFVRGTADLLSLEEFSAAGLPETRRKFDDVGAKVVVVDTSVRMNSLDSATRAQNLELAKRYLEIAVGLGARHLRVFGGAIPEDQSEEETREAISKGLSDVAELTWGAGVESLIETHDSYSTSDSIRELYEHGASEHLGVLWDSLHTFRHGETAEESWSKLGDRIRHVHVKDSNQASPASFDFALTGEGIVPIPHILDVLRNAGFDRYVHFEWEKGWHPEIAEPDIAIPHFAKYMAAVLA